MATHDAELLAQKARAEIDSMSKKLGPMLLGTTQPDAHRVDREAYLKFVRGVWFAGYPGKPAIEFRNELLGRVGPDTFVATAKEAWAGHEQEYTDAQVASMAPPPMPVIPPTGPMPAPPPLIQQPPPPPMAYGAPPPAPGMAPPGPPPPPFVLPPAGPQMPPPPGSPFSQG